MRKINYTHVILALFLGAVAMHLYRTQTTQGKQSGK